ncbi:MAG: hypothetical protein ACE5JU_18745 [Candidatus Binatia bacterium]
MLLFRASGQLFDVLAGRSVRACISRAFFYPLLMFLAWAPAVCLAVMVLDVSAEELKLKVPAEAGGKFGAFVLGSRNEDAQGMIKAYVFKKPGTITIKAKGHVDLHPDSVDLQGIPPEGFLFYGRGYGTYSPLEEAVVDAKGLSALPHPMEHAGALMGAFVPAARATSPNFHPWNDEFGGGISSDKLFLIGRGPNKFTATEPGILFLGVNDPRSANNSGAFRVRIRGD